MHVGADQSASSERLMPVRMLNEFVFCPRLFFLEYVQGEFEDNELTMEGNAVHARVDAGGGTVPGAAAERPFAVRSLVLSSESLGLSAKIDLVEGEGDGAVVPVDYKRGAPPSNGQGAHDPERVQLCAYALLLREHGYRCERGVLYFAAAKTRVEVAFDDPLMEQTRHALNAARALAATAGPIPPPLRASPKCRGCSLHAICLPDELTLLREGEAPEMRALRPARDDAVPVHVTEQGAKVGVSGGVLSVIGREGEKLGEPRLSGTSQVVLWGNVTISSQAMRECLARDLPVSFMSYGGWFSGMTDGLGHSHVDLRRAQYRAADEPVTSLRIAKRIVRVKLANCRTLLRRNAGEGAEGAVRELAEMCSRVDGVARAEELLGIEGNGARIYFGQFQRMLKGGSEFDFASRNRRPPKDPVNALLSLAYSMLAREVAVVARQVGLDPMLGFYHRPRFGRPALALDLMEEFRPIIADSVVLTAVNTAVVNGEDFQRSVLGVALRPDARKRFIKSFERRMREQVTHPVFGYRISYRRVLEVQLRLFGRHLMGEIPEYPEFKTR